MRNFFATREATRAFVGGKRAACSRIERRPVGVAAAPHARATSARLQKHG